MEAQGIPTEFHNGLITVHTRTTDGVPLVFDLDSGGSMPCLLRPWRVLGLLRVRYGQTGVKRSPRSTFRSTP